MAIPVLVVDANINDGKGIQKSLEATGHFQVTIATRAIEALMRFTETKFHVAVIDFGLPDLNGVDLIRQMHGIDESITVVAVLDEQRLQASELKKLSVGVILDKPTYLSDLPSTLSKLLNLASKPPIPNLPPPDPVKIQTKSPHEVINLEQQVASEEVIMGEEEVETDVRTEVREDPIPPWLKDPLLVKDYLSRLGKEHSGYAWLLSRGATPWNFSETLTENQALGIVRLLSEHDEGLQSKGALIRYIRLSGSGNDYLLYAAPVISDINLTLIFSMETPFSVARRQTHKISRLLIEEDPRKPIRQVVPTKSEELSTPSLDDEEPLQPSAWIPASKPSEMSPEAVAAPDLIPAIDDIPQPDPVQTTPDIQVEPDVLAVPVIEGMPDIQSAPPVQVAESMPALAEELVAEEKPVTQEVPKASTVLVSEELPVKDSTPSTPIAKEEPVQVKALVAEEIPVEMEGLVEADLSSAASITSAPEAPPLPTDWLPKNPKPASHLPFLDPLPRAPEQIREPDPVNVALHEPKYFLPFTAILLPRFPNHKLIGSLANQLETWLNDLCIAWGWRMAKIDIRPEYLRFTLYLSPDVAPAQSVQSLAQNLSTRIMQAFSSLSNDLPSGQFWTKSYLLTAGSDVGKDRLATFIETTRKEQGLTS